MKRWPLLNRWECGIANAALVVDALADGLLRLATRLHATVHVWALRTTARMALRGIRRLEGG